MKRFIALLISIFMTLGCLTAVSESEPIVGGWTVAGNNSITQERKAIFDKALNGLVGVDYEPIANLGSQTVAGTNHCFLCRATVVYPAAQPRLVFIYIYEDLIGNSEILRIVNMELDAAFESDY